MTGKLADTVMSVRNGEQLARKYQPVVFNPSTPAQVAQRAKLKLLSQLSAVMATVIAIPRQGSVSSRNLFTKVNFPATTYADSEAEINLANVQLTKSVVGLLPVTANREEDAISASLVTTSVSGSGEVASSDYSRVVYAMFVKSGNQKLRFVASRVATTPGEYNEFPVSFPISNLETVILAYAVRDNSDAARATFGNLTAVTAETVASLIVTRTLLDSDVTVTETRGFQLAAAASRDGGEETKKKTSKKD